MSRFLKSVIASSRSTETEFSPSDIPNASFWWRADLGINLVSDRVESWEDQIDAVSASQASSGDRPFHDEINSDMNNQSSVRGENGQWLEGTVSVTYGSGWEVIFVIRTIDTTEDARLVLHLYDASGSSSIRVGKRFNHRADVVITDDNGNSRTALSSTLINDGNLYVIRATFDSSTREMEVYVNDVLEGTNTLGGTGDFTINRARILARDDGFKRFDGDCAELFVSDGLLSSSDETQMSSYLSGRYDSF